MTTVESISCEQSEAMAGQICAAAAVSAQSECRLLELLGEFDATNAVRWWQGVKSVAHWLSWSCSMSPGTARACAGGTDPPPEGASPGALVGGWAD